MIRFHCTCGQPFELADERGGESLQCPRCMRLVEVPTAREADAIAPDGTVKLDAPPAHHSDLASKFRAFGGHDDLRQRAEDLILAPPNDPPTELQPHYDPETGELVQAIDLQPSEAHVVPQDTAPDLPPAPVLPIERAQLAYSTDFTAPTPERPVRTLYWWQLPWRLLQGMSLIAIVFVFAAHVVAHLLLIIPGLNLILLPLALVVAMAIAAHYANVMEEFGPREHDRVPVLLRSVSFTEDLLQPLYAILWAGVFAYGPVLLALAIGMRRELLEQPWLLFALSGWGMFVFPAAALTMATSGALANLLPTHIFSVIRVAPGRYLLACVMFVVGIGAYVLALRGIVFTSLAFVTRPVGATAWRDVLRDTAFMYSMLIIAVYTLHLSAAWLGMIYRTHYQRFNWVWQRHEKEPRLQTLVRRRRQPRHVVDQARLAEIRELEADRRARHAESMRK